MDCIPAGMEMFPAIDEDQFEFIKTVIDDCDYYLLIIAGRYGSLDPQGVSYTEKEYDYAVAKEIPVITLMHANPGSIEFGKTEQTEEGRKKLTKFREKAQSGRLSKEWKTPDDLAGLVSRALHISFKRFPAVGWIRANKAASQDLLNDVNLLRNANDQLKEKLAQLENNLPVVEDIASLDDEFTVHGIATFYSGSGYNPGSETRSWVNKLSWRKIFETVSPYLMQYESDKSVKGLLADNLRTYQRGSACINDQDFQTIKIQLQAYNLIKVECLKNSSGRDYYWSLTQRGRALMVSLRTIKKGEVERGY